MSDDAAWKVLPHQPIQKLEENLWFVVGSLGGSAPLKRTMVIGKRSDGRLVIHNAVALEDAAMKEIEAWGEPAFLLVPNGYHRIDARRFKDRYPAIKVLAPAGSRKRIEEKVHVDGSYEDYPADADVEVVNMDGVKQAEGAMLVHSKSGTTVAVTDAIFNMPHATGFGGFLVKYIFASSGGPKLSRLARMALVKDKTAFRAQLEKFAEIPDLVRVLVAHHEPIDHEPKEALRRVAATI
jgi:hypothetical protein